MIAAHLAYTGRTEPMIESQAKKVCIGQCQIDWTQSPETEISQRNSVDRALTRQLSVEFLILLVSFAKRVYVDDTLVNFSGSVRAISRIATVGDLMRPS